jgi:hypothetical protein
MKKVVALLILNYLLFNTPCIAQEYKRGLNWVTGYSGNKVRFNGGISTSLGVNAFKYFIAGSSAISDTNGNLLFYSNGYDIFNGITGIVIDAGDTLVPKDFYTDQYGNSALSQSSMFLPKDSTTFYFITPAMSDSRFADCNALVNCYFDLLLYNVIDMNANGGLGKVTKRMVPLMQNANLRKTQMMACRHGNGKDWWLLKNEGDNADVHTFLFTQDSVFDKGVQVFTQPNWGPWDIRGQSTFNNDGSMFASTSHGSSSGYIFIADFDRCHGILNNNRTIQMPWNSQHDPMDTTIMERLSVGLAFSPNNQFLYVISMSNIYQYDLQDNTWFQIVGLDTTYAAFQNYETAYIGVDGKIYIGNWAGLSKQMSRIDNPDVKGVGCNFCPRCLRLDSLGANAYVGTPPCMPNYGLGAKTCWPLATNQLSNLNEALEVYPNPSSSVFYFKNKHGKKKELFTMLGELLFTTTKDEIDVSRYSKGVYYLRCEHDIRKIIIE